MGDNDFNIPGLFELVSFSSLDRKILSSLHSIKLNLYITNAAEKQFIDVALIRTMQKLEICFIV